MHDVGQIVIALGMPAEYSAIERETASTGRAKHLLEKERLGVSHAEVGAYLLGVWGLPFSIVEAVAYHHHPDAIREGPCDTLAALHVADALVSGEASELDQEFLSRTGFAEKLPAWQTVVEQENAKGVAA